MLFRSLLGEKKDAVEVGVCELVLVWIILEALLLLPEDALPITLGLLLPALVADLLEALLELFAEASGHPGAETRSAADAAQLLGLVDQICKLSMLTT